MERLSVPVATADVPSYQGIIVQADWDRHNWTLVVGVSGKGRRLLQLPAYGKTPQVGDRIQLTGRNPLYGAQIEGVNISLQQAIRASEPLPLRFSMRRP